MSLLGMEKYLFSGQLGMWRDTCVVQLSCSGRKECTHGAATPLDIMCFLGCCGLETGGQGDSYSVIPVLTFDSFSLGGCYDNCHPSF